MSGIDQLALSPRNVEEATTLAERLSKSALLPMAMRGKAVDILLTILAGAELGLPPMASLRVIHVIEGKPVLSADGMIAAILGSGKAVYFHRVDETPDSVTYETLRVGGKGPRRCIWTLAQAKAAALDRKDNWRLYPRAMLAARAKAELARDVYPDVLAGCYTDDELDIASGIGNAIDAEYTEHADPRDVVAPASALRELSNAQTELMDHVADEYAAAYEAASDQLASQLDLVTAGYLETIGNAPDLQTLDRVAAGPGKPAKGTKEHELATVAYRRRRALLQAEPKP